MHQLHSQDILLVYKSIEQTRMYASAAAGGLSCMSCVKKERIRILDNAVFTYTCVMQVSKQRCSSLLLCIRL